MFFNLQYKCAEVPISPISKSAPPFSAASSFSKNVSTQVRINKMVNEHTVDYHTGPSEFTSRIHPLMLLWSPKRFISPEYFFKLFLKPVYPTMVAKNFKFMVLRLLENTFVSQIESGYSCSPSKTLP